MIEFSEIQVAFQMGTATHFPNVPNILGEMIDGWKTSIAIDPIDVIINNMKFHCIHHDPKISWLTAEVNLIAVEWHLLKDNPPLKLIDQIGEYKLSFIGDKINGDGRDIAKDFKELVRNFSGYRRVIITPCDIKKEKNIPNRIDSSLFRF
jgi:hypothetical protein